MTEIGDNQKLSYVRYFSSVIVCCNEVNFEKLSLYAVTNPRSKLFIIGKSRDMHLVSAFFRC